MRPTRREEPELEPVPTMVEVKIGNEDGGLVAWRLDDAPSVRIRDERRPVERERAAGSDAVDGDHERVVGARPFAAIIWGHSGCVSKSTMFGPLPIAVGYTRISAPPIE